MQKFELSFDSIGCNETYTKEITILVVAPDKFDDKTGAMLFCHGWGGNRFQHQEFMKAVADKFNLLCLSPEYRMSGFDYAPRSGLGWFKPYDLSFYQTFDALLALRFILRLHTNLNHKRIFVYGGSQGGHIALLSAIYAPNTFAAVYSSSAMVCVPNQPNLAEATGRFFTDAECETETEGLGGDTEHHLVIHVRGEGGPLARRVACNTVAVCRAQGYQVAPVHEVGRVNVPLHGRGFARCPCGVIVGAPV